MNEIINISIEDIIKLTNGCDEVGQPNAAASLSIDLMLPEEVKNIQSQVLEQAVIHLHISGGAAVVKADFGYLSRSPYQKCLNICNEWLKTINQPGDERLSLVIVPYTLSGQIVLCFDQLVFCDGYDDGNQSHLILVFDNESSYIMETDSIDYEKIKNEIEIELRRYEEDLDAEIEEAIREEQEIKKQENALEKRIKEDLNHPLDRIMESNSDSKRVTEENQQVRFVDEEGTYYD